ncbi:Alpha/Beta hydrolase protein [Xylariales sp. PMI_506]|nr:Alpha/Beta hydrolase protein [Xylariales sp. PMI_506]
MVSLSYDKEFAEAIKSFPSIQIPALETVFDTRNAINGFTSAAAKALSVPEGIKETKYQVTSDDGAGLELLRFEPPHLDADEEAGGRPCILFIHGGGLIALSTDIFRPLYQFTAVATKRLVFAVPYRLAPEFPFPTPLEDMCASIKWVSGHAQELGIDPRRIALYGQSAGACLALSAALKLRDEGLQPPIAKLILQQPLIDDRTSLPADHPKRKLLVWTQELNNMGWEAYLGKNWAEDKEKEVSEYASPGRATNLAGLPRTFIDSATLDLYCADSVALASKLTNSDVEVEVHIYRGVPHAFDSIAPGISMAKDIAKKRIAALQDF